MASDHPGAKLDYDKELDALVVSVKGERTLALANALMGEIMARLRSHATNRLLFDVRQASYPGDLQDSIDAFLEISRPAEGLQIALVFDPAQRETGVIMQTTGSTRWNFVRLFHDPDSARHWLGENRD